MDAAYYTFPSQQYREGMVTETPDNFLFGLKVAKAFKLGDAKRMRLAALDDPDLEPLWK